MSLNVTFKRDSIEAEMEFGSLEELAGFISEKSVLLTKIYGEDIEIVAKGLLDNTDSTALATGTVETGEAPKGRGRPKKNTPDPSTATAPPPAAIPGATPPDTTLTDKGMPAFLDRTSPAAAVSAAAPPAPPPPPPAPVAAVVPPSGILAGKVIADLDRRGTDDTTKAALVNWLASPGLALVMPAASYDEAISAIRLMPDDKLAAVATQLAVG